jgi:predicted O-methyltransferase YrrM
MEEILNRYKKPIRALEIGTFFGDNSTQLLLKHLPAGSELFLLDGWQKYREGHNLKEDKYAKKMDSLLHLGFLSTIRNVVFNKLSSKREVKVTIIRGKSSNVLKLLASNTFDFIYIDGSHYYSDVKVDLQNSLRIINQKFGIICGDDLERMPTLSNMSLASKHLDNDFYQDFHPGVLLAVGEVIRSVNMKDGFWWTFVREGNITLRI